MFRRLIVVFCLLTVVLSVKAQSAESDAAFSRGIDLFRNGDFAEAARFFEQADALDRVQLDTITSSRWAYARQWAAHCHYRLGDKAKARALCKYGYEIEPVDRRLSVVSDRLAENTYKNMAKGDYAAAIKPAERTLAEEIRILGEENSNVLGSYCILADLYSTAGEMDKALECIKKALSLYKKLSPPDDLTDYYCNIARYTNITFNSSTSTDIDREECYALLKEAAEYLSACGDAYLSDYAEILMFITDFAIYKGQIEDADSAQEKLMAIWENLPKDQRYQYAAILKNHQNYLLHIATVDISRNILAEQFIEPAETYSSLIKEAEGEYSEAYADALINSANAKYNAGLFRDSLKDYERSIRLLKFLYGDQDLFIYADIYFSMCRAAYQLLEPNTAIAYGNEAFRLTQIFYPDNIEFQANIYHFLSNCYSTKQQYQKALEMAEKSKKFLDDAGKTDTPLYADIVLAYADRLTSCNRRDDALTVVERIISDLQAHDEIRSSKYLDAIICLFNLLDGLGRHDEATEARQRELERRGEFGEYEHIFTFRILYNEAANLFSTKNYEQSLALCNSLLNDYSDHLSFWQQLSRLKAQNLTALIRVSEAIAIYDEILQTATDVDRTTTMYADILKDKALAYMATGNSSLVESTLQPAIEIYRNQYGEYSPQYVEIIIGISNIMVETAVLDVAEKYNQEALRILKRGIGENSASYLAFANLCGAKIAFLKGEYERAIALASAMISGIENFGQAYNQQLGNAYVTIGDSQQNLANFSAAAEAYENALTAFENLNGSRFNLECGLAFNSLANLYQKMGNQEKENLYRGLASEIYLKLAPKESYQYAIALSFKVQKAMHEGNTDSAINHFIEMKQYIENFIDDKSKIKYILDLANINFECLSDGPTDKIRESARELHDRLIKEDFYSADIQPNAIALFFNLEMFNEALNIARLSESKIHKIYGRTSPQAVEIYFKLTDIYNKLGNRGKVTEYLGKTFNTGRDVLLGAFTTMTQEERANFWNNYYPFFRQGLPYVCYTNPSIKDITKVTYNGTLLGTGILLEAERNLSDMIARDGSESLKQNYDAFRSTKAQFNHLSSQLQNFSGTDLLTASAQADSLNAALNIMERNLLSQVGTELGDFTGTLRIEWTDVRSALKKNDIAIEFIEFFDNDTIITAALCLKKDFKEPKFIKLFTRDATDTGFADDCYSNPALSKAIWGTLAPTIADAGNIYFSTQGALCNVAIESMPMKDIFADTRGRRFYRLSSTRELAINRKAPATNDAVLFGGLNYDMTVDEMKADTASYPGMKRSGATFATGLRGSVGIEPLPGTLKEIEDIGEALNNAPKTKFNVREIKGNEGTETSFKQLSGSKKRIIHIGTHGYYVSVDDMRDDDMLMRLFGESSGDNRSREDKILSRSGLFFSGAANNYKEDLSTVDGLLDDGVLTAQEISVLDLSDLDMIVLSACETARGDLSGDGVFGLQRGFKKAGAASILMSLWKVDDDATRILMTEFYRNIAEGKSKYESLELAKDKLKGDSEFNDPDYWAAFILLDAPN